MPGRTKRVFISDIHLGTNQSWDWYQRDEHEAPLLAMLAYVARPESGVKDLVLLGDVFETWLGPLGERPRPLSDVFASNTKVLNAISGCAAAIPNVFYVNGNHDMHLSPADIATAMPGVRHIKQYHSGLLHAEHGSRFAMFNAPDRLHDPRAGLPLGYFISRILTGHEDYIKPGSLIRYIDDLLEAAFTTQKIAESVVEALAEHAQIGLGDPIHMPQGRAPMTLMEVQRKYAALFDRWVERFGFRYAINSVRAEGGELGWFADRECRKRDYRVVVLGHTHDDALDEDGWRASTQTIYANSGYWCPKGSEHAHFVEVDKRVATCSVAVRVLDSAGKPEDVKREEITF